MFSGSFRFETNLDRARRRDVELDPALSTAFAIDDDGVASCCQRHRDFVGLPHSQVVVVVGMHQVDAFVVDDAEMRRSAARRRLGDDAKQGRGNETGPHLEEWERQASRESSDAGSFRGPRLNDEKVVAFCEIAELELAVRIGVDVVPGRIDKLVAFSATDEDGDLGERTSVRMPDDSADARVGTWDFDRDRLRPRRIGDVEVVVAGRMSCDRVRLDMHDSSPARVEHQSAFQVGPGTDLERGLVFYSCRRGVVHVKADSITGHAAGHYYFDVPDPPRTEPVTVEVPRADAGVRGVVRHADGSPFSKVPILVCRRERDQLVDATGDDVYTNSDGEFEFSNLAKGDHFLVVQAWPAEAPCIARFTAGLPFPFLEMRTSLVPSTLFRIVAESSTSGAPTHFRIVDHEGVDLMHPDNNDDLRMGKTNEVSVPLTTGRYTVVVDREGCRQRRVEFDVPAPGPVEIRLEAETPTEH